MATNFPTSLDVLTNPTGSSSLTSPDHATQHTNANDAIEAIEAQIGTTASPVLARLASPSFTGNLSVDTDTLFVDGSTNKVGIGTVTPATALAVQGTAVTVTNQTGTIATFGTTTSGRLLVGTITGSNSTSAFIGSEGDTTLHLTQNSVPRLSIEVGGDVGIGTVSPTTKLDVAGTVTAYSFAGPLASTVTATTQTAADSSTKVATTAFVTTANNLKQNLPVGAAWTPTLGLGTWSNMTFTGRYVQVNKLIQFWIRGEATGACVLSTGFTPPCFNFPVAAQNTALAGYGFVVTISDSSASVSYTGATTGGDVLGVGVIRPFVTLASGTYASLSALTTTVPMTWASGDTIFIQGTYEAA